MEHLTAKCPVCNSETELCYRPSGHAVFGKQWHMPREDATALLNKDTCEACADWLEERKLVLA